MNADVRSIQNLLFERRAAVIAKEGTRDQALKAMLVRKINQIDSEVARRRVVQPVATRTP